MVKKKTKLYSAILIFGIIENLVLLMFFKIPLDKTTFISTILFTVVLMFILNKLDLVPDG